MVKLHRDFPIFHVSRLGKLSLFSGRRRRRTKLATKLNRNFGPFETMQNVLASTLFCFDIRFKIVFFNFDNRENCHPTMDKYWAKSNIGEVQQNHSLLKPHAINRGSALRALNGTLLLVSLSSSHRTLSRKNDFEMAIFGPTRPTNQNQTKTKIFNFCVFYPIWIKCGMGAYTSQKTASNELDIVMATL